MPTSAASAVVPAAGAGHRSARAQAGSALPRSQPRGLHLASNLPALQNLIKRDPQSYPDDFIAQWNHYQSLRSILVADLAADTPGASAVAAATSSRLARDEAERFTALLSFVTQLAPSFPAITASLPAELSSLLLEHQANLTPEVRRAAVRSLVLLRNRDVITSEDLLRTLFPLLTLTTSPALRTMLHQLIMQDIKNANLKAKNHRLNRLAQGLLFSVVERGMVNQQGAYEARRGVLKEAKGKSEALWATRLAAELWKKGIWTDAKTVSLLALACFHPHPKVQSSAIRFFLGDLHSAENGDEEGSDDDDDGPSMDQLKHQRKVKKKTRSSEKKIEKAAAAARKKRAKKAEEEEDTAPEMSAEGGNQAALHLLNDPQGFGERLFDELSKGDKRLAIDVKVRIMQLLARVMGAHRCAVLGFYSFVVKYLVPHQQHITLILVSLAQSVHNLTPPDALFLLIRKLTDSFVHPGVSNEVNAAGLNTIREMCTRQPFAMEMEGGKELLSDLVLYRKNKDKGVSAAARGLLALYREVNPSLLAKRERGKSGTTKLLAGVQARRFGEDLEGVHGIQGIELLEAHMEERKRAEEEEGVDEEEADRRAWKDWEVESDSDEESEGGWIDVSSEGEGSEGGIDISDSDESSESDKGDSDEDDSEDDEDEDEGGKKGDKKKTPRERREENRRKRRLAKKRKSEVGSEKGGEEEEEDSDEEMEEEEEEGDGEKASAQPQPAAPAVDSFSQLATTKILTPADFAKLSELRQAAAASGTSSKKKGATAAEAGAEGDEGGKRRITSTAAEAATAPSSTLISETDILGVRKKRKADYEERMASIAAGREGREKFGSKKGKKEKHSSSTNEEKKKRSKNFQMVAHSWEVRSKGKASLREKSRRLKAHRKKQKSQKMSH